MVAKNHDGLNFQKQPYGRRPLPPETPTVWKPAYTTVTTWACKAEEFSQKCTRMCYGWKLLGIDQANPVSDEDEFSEETEDMLKRTKSNPNAIIYGRFHTYPKM